MVESSKPIVLITGVSGYLGSHVALVFLKDGGFNVRGTVRDTKNANKIEPNFENTTLKYLIKISPITWCNKYKGYEIFPKKEKVNINKLLFTTLYLTRRNQGIAIKTIKNWTSENGWEYGEIFK